LSSTRDPIQNASVVDRDILFGDDLDHFLRGHATGKCRDVVQFPSSSPRNFVGDLSYACVGQGARDGLADSGKNIR
jgi:hypothetical protein